MPEHDPVAGAVEIAARVHAGQVDKGGHPYILHPLAVMAAVQATPVDNPHERRALLCAAVLHDALEDAPAHQDRRELEQHIYYTVGDRAFAAILALTRRPDEPYLTQYLDRVEQDWIARRVKLADLRHNLDVTRLPAGALGTRLGRYRAALERLQDAEARYSPLTNVSSGRSSRGTL